MEESLSGTLPIQSAAEDAVEAELQDLTEQEEAVYHDEMSTLAAAAVEAVEAVDAADAVDQEPVKTETQDSQHGRQFEVVTATVSGEPSEVTGAPHTTESLEPEEQEAEDSEDDEDKPSPNSSSSKSGFDQSGVEEDFATAPVARPTTPCEQASHQRLQKLTAMLSEHPLFEHCGPNFVTAVLKRAERLFLSTHEVLPLDDEGPLYVVDTGVLLARAGPSTSPCSLVGYGAVLNGAGFLGLYKEAESYRPRRVSLKPDDHPRSTRADGYDVAGYNGPPPSLFRDRRGPAASPEALAAQGPGDNALCLFNLCPYATLKKNERRRTSWLDVVICGAPPGQHPAGPQSGMAKEMLPTGGGTVLALPPLKVLVEIGRQIKATEYNNVTQKVSGLPAIELPVGGTKMPQAVQTFKYNCERLKRNWKDLMQGMSGVVLPGVHPEVVWSFTETAEPVMVPTGSFVVSEDEVGEVGDCLVFIAEGVAMVEKRVKCVDSQPHYETIGRLRAGAIIGSLSTIGAEIPRAASVRAKTDVQALKLHSRKLEGVLARYPGILDCCKEKLFEAAEFWKERLLTRTEVASSLNLFHGCNLRFVNEVANAGERRTLLCGEPVVEEGSTAGTLFVLEIGRCAVEVNGIGKVAEVPAGNCFGERTLLGIGAQANATVRVSTPFALVLSIPRTVMHAALREHPDQKDHFDRLKKAPMEGRVAGSKVRHVELFRPCGSGFLDCLNSKVKTCAYMPGQTIVVEGDVEKDPRMFVLIGGTIVAERSGKPLARMAPGATFGELAMLGLAKERAVTVRAVTLSFVMSIQSTAFLDALDHFPDEQERFEQVLTDTQYNARVAWPCLQGQPTRLLYLLDLYGEKATCPVGSDKLLRPPFDEAAVLILDGELQVQNSKGDIIATLTSGMCCNEQILAGSLSKPTYKLFPLTVCQVRLLTRETWGKVIAEFPTEADRVRKAILRYMAEEAEKKLGFSPNSSALLRSSCACLKFVADAFCDVLRSLLETRLYEPGEVIARSNGPAPVSEGGSEDFFICLAGQATLITALGAQTVKSGEGFGEAVMLKTVRNYVGTLKAEDLTIMQVLRRKDLEAAAEEGVGVMEFQHLLERLHKEVQPVGVEQLQKRLMWSSAFRGAGAAFVSNLCRCPDIVIFAPGSIILEQGDKTILGESCFYLVMAGRVRVEGPFGTLFGMVGAGQVFGEVGALGLAEARTANARAWEDGLVCCLRVQGQTILAALAACPYAKDPLQERWSRLEAANVQTEQRRREWIQDTAIPALARTPLLAGCPKSFLHNLAVQLCETAYNTGDIIAKVGERFPMMLLILKGSAQIEAGNGTRVGRMVEGSIFGEVNALGLYHYCMATVRATAPTVVVTMTDCALREALKSKGSEAKEMREAFQALVASRHEQVSRGLPMTGLPINANPDDVCVRAVALLSEQLNFMPGEVWQAVPDDDPCGPHFGVVLSGRLMIEMGSDRHNVMQLHAGNAFPEGLAAEYGAYARAETVVEAYRIRRSDFEMAICKSAVQRDWIWRLKMEEKTVFDRLRSRLNSVRGLLEGAVPNMRDREIQEWKTKRRLSCNKAKLKTQEEGDDKMPQMKGSGLFSSPSRDLPTRMANWPGLHWQHPDLSVYPVLQLPRLTKGGRKGALKGSRSDTSLMASTCTDDSFLKR